MATQPVTCSGGHASPVVLGAVTVPQDRKDTIADAASGYLCEDCGAAYNLLVFLTGHVDPARWPKPLTAHLPHPPGTTPSPDAVDQALAFTDKSRVHPR